MSHMPYTRVNGVNLFWESTGTGPAVVLVHGAWVDHADWNALVPHLAESFRVVAYDRRGHSQSERLTTQSRMADDVDDLAGLISMLDLGPAHVVGNSYGGMVALRLAVARPELVVSVTAHEPPFLHLNERILADPTVARIDRIQRDAVTRLEQGDLDVGISAFVNAVVEPGAWDGIPPEFREFLRSNAPSFVDDVNDPDPWTVDLEGLGELSMPMLLTQGGESPAFYGHIIDELVSHAPTALRATIADAGHGAHVWQPATYAALLRDAVLHPH